MHTEGFILIPKKSFCHINPYKMKFLKALIVNRRQLNYHFLNRQSEKPQNEDKTLKIMSSVLKNKETTKEQTSEPVSKNSVIEPIFKEANDFPVSVYYI